MLTVGSTEVKTMFSGPDVFFDQSGWSARRPPRLIVCVTWPLIPSKIIRLAGPVPFGFPSP